MYEIRISTSLLHVQMNVKPHKQEPFIIDYIISIRHYRSILAMQ